MNGVNRLFGFSNRQLIPTFRPPFNIVKNVNSIILYGAGTVGRDYYQTLQVEKFVEIVGWIDEQYVNYQQQGMPVEAIEKVNQKQYDAVLIAIENEKTAGLIKENLLALGVPCKKILWEKPETLLDYWGKTLM